MHAPAEMIHGDATTTLAAKRAQSVDMVYSDPPFGNEQDWHGKTGSFSDKWTWSERSTAGFAALDSIRADAAALILATCHDGRESAKAAYLGFMAGMLVECRRVLKPTGTLWLHHDDTMGAELRVLCCAIFGPDLEVGTLIWKRTHSHNISSGSFGRVHDTIACYARSRAALWRLWRIGTVGGDPCSGDWWPRFDDFATASSLASGSKERVNYPTQKPVQLLKELIAAATLKGETVLDPTMHAYRVDTHTYKSLRKMT